MGRRKAKEPEVKEDLLLTLIFTEETHKDGMWLSSGGERIAEERPDLFQRQNKDTPKLFKLTDAGHAVLKKARESIAR